MFVSSEYKQNKNRHVTPTHLNQTTFYLKKSTKAEISPSILFKYTFPNSFKFILDSIPFHDVDNFKRKCTSNVSFSVQYIISEIISYQIINNAICFVID